MRTRPNRRSLGLLPLHLAAPRQPSPGTARSDRLAVVVSSQRDHLPRWRHPRRTFYWVPVLPLDGVL
uniref:Putative secreted protein n=1 Tax=Anopheles darlingi TaxID=43151 RepID=A0A2M4D0I6_ANODA